MIHLSPKSGVKSQDSNSINFTLTDGVNLSNLTDVELKKVKGLRPSLTTYWQISVELEEFLPGVTFLECPGLH